MGQPPYRTIRSEKEKGLQVTIWENFSRKDGTRFLSIQFQGSYKDKKTEKYKTKKTYFSKEIEAFIPMLEEALGIVQAEEAEMGLPDYQQQRKDTVTSGAPTFAEPDDEDYLK